MRFGVDEAGKGPVLGSMFAAAVRAEPAALPDGVGDSKDIKPQRRERLAEEIHESADAVGVAEIPVERIDDDETDMNTLTVEAQAEALSAVARDGLSGTVDAGDTDAERFGRRVAGAVDAEVTVTAEHGADETDPLVGAASIIAKEAREAHVAELAEEYGDVGSGYPSDPTTRSFLADCVDRHGELPACARRSWSTCDDVLAAAEQATLGDF
ncbi:RNase HII [Haloarcula vallismortis]|uniref:Ribonuclease HII n=2 Tax=Haloarcula vallismortis TaxID=28442 RepID=M0IYD0_HALVA|nr:ribonuclease HII [Haloarcula vallismortis]EMA00799.1 ribonuclease HII [Haloarcula vallismortis ATCC 29715]SDW06090.1 RNase HII [Haloarcula vallismortis]